MKWLEIINLRSMGNGLEKLQTEIKQSVSGSQKPDALTKVHFYTHYGVHTDMGIHLHWNTENVEIQGSGLGQRLAFACKQFGRVDLSVWVEKEF